MLTPGNKSKTGQSVPYKAWNSVMSQMSHAMALLEKVVQKVLQGLVVHNTALRLDLNLVDTSQQSGLA